MVFGSNSGSNRFDVIGDDDDLVPPVGGGYHQTIDSLRNNLIYEWTNRTTWIDDGFPADLSGEDPDAMRTPTSDVAVIFNFKVAIP